MKGYPRNTCLIKSLWTCVRLMMQTKQCCAMTLYYSYENTVLRYTKNDVSKLEETVSTLVSILWDTDPHMNKFKAQSCVIPEIFHQFCGFNDPKWHNHAVKQLSREALTTFYMSLMIQLETSFMYIQKSFKSFKDTFDNLLKLFMATLNTLKEAAVWQKSHPLKLMCQKCYILDMHVLPTAKHLNAYLSKEKTILKKPMNVLAEKKILSL